MPSKIIWMQFILYLVVGGLSSCVDVGGFWVLVTMSVPLMVASSRSRASWLRPWSITFSRTRWHLCEDGILNRPS